MNLFCRNWTFNICALKNGLRVIHATVSNPVMKLSTIPDTSPTARTKWLVSARYYQVITLHNQASTQ
jgi:hypothetical protein